MSAFDNQNDKELREEIYRIYEELKMTGSKEDIAALPKEALPDQYRSISLRDVELLQNKATELVIDYNYYAIRAAALAKEQQDRRIEALMHEMVDLDYATEQSVRSEIETIYRDSTKYQIALPVEDEDEDDLAALDSIKISEQKMDQLRTEISKGRKLAIDLQRAKTDFMAKEAEFSGEKAEKMKRAILANDDNYFLTPSSSKSSHREEREQREQREQKGAKISGLSTIDLSLDGARRRLDEQQRKTEERYGNDTVVTPRLTKNSGRITGRSLR